MFHLFHLKTIKSNLVVLTNVWGFGDNTKYIAEELLKISNHIQAVFITNYPESAKAPEQITILKTNSISAIHALATAKVWVDCNRKEAYIRKRKGQYYIQTWHGGLPLKKIEGDCEEYLGKEYIKRAKWDSAMTDLYISNGGFCSEMYRRAFWYQGEILEYGTPRNDILLNNSQERISYTRAALNIREGVKIAIYAPTYRESGETDAYLKNMEDILQVLTSSYQGEWVLVIRLHPLVAAVHKDIYTYGRDILDGSKCRDMYELMEAADLLITDYSNTMFEFAMMYKPVFLLTKDLKKYQGGRGFYFEPKELPFSIAITEEELSGNLEEFFMPAYRKNIEEFFQNVDIKESGSASKKTAERIKEVIKNEK